MRMWMVNPKLLCRKHLLGEHSEIHKHRHVFEKGWSIEKRVIKPFPQIEPKSMEMRHNALVDEMIARGYKHQSPYSQPSLDAYKGVNDIIVNTKHSIMDLYERCEDCKNLCVKRD